jgi:hypothetical protein
MREEAVGNETVKMQQHEENHRLYINVTDYILFNKSFRVYRLVHFLPHWAVVLTIPSTNT